jgi:ubiquinone/menaquinone biosynthesis C-methylase UbiE
LSSNEAGVLRYRLRCIDKIGYSFRGDESLLDAGCGDGEVARLQRARVREVTAIDVESSPVWHDEPGPAFRVANAEQLPFADASFHLLHSKDSLHHMESPERALQEYRRMLRPEGTALIIESNRYNPITSAHSFAAHSRPCASVPSKRTSHRHSTACSECRTPSRKRSSDFLPFGRSCRTASPSRPTERR